MAAAQAIPHRSLLPEFAGTSTTFSDEVRLTSRERDRQEFLLFAAEQHQPLAKEYLPRLFGNDPELTELDLTDKHVTDISANTLADALKLNTVLTSLNLAENYIERDGAMALAEMMEENTTLRELNLSDNDIDPNSVYRFIEALENNNTVDLMSVENNKLLDEEVVNELYCAVKLNTTPKQLKMVVKDLRAIKAGNLVADLRYIDLSCQEGSKDILDDFGAKALANALRGNTKTEVLKLAYNCIGDEGAYELAWMLEDNTALDEINLFSNGVGALGCEAFVEVLTEHNNYLTKLNLQSNNVSDDLLVELEWALVLNRQPLNLKKFIKPLRMNDPDLTMLHFDEHLSQRFYDDISARILADALQDNTHLKSLSLPNNHVTEVGAHFLADMLLLNSTLNHLDLTGNDMTGGSKWLAQALRANTTLSSLGLAGCSIPDEEAWELAEMLRTNQSLTEVDLRDNRIASVGAAFVRAFHGNSTLQDLLLEGNNLSIAHMHQIAQGKVLNSQPKQLRSAITALSQDPDKQPTRLNLAYDKDKQKQALNDNSASLLAHSLQENYTVTHLDLADNDIGISGVRALCRMLDKNFNTLMYLSLARNQELNYDAAEELAEVLGFHKSLSHLDISYNSFGEEGMGLFLKPLEREKMLTEFDIEGTRCSAKLYNRIKAVVLANKYSPALKNKMIALMNGDYVSHPALDFSEYTDFTGWSEKDPRYDGAAKVLAASMKGQEFFQTFRFTKNHLADEGCESLVNFFLNDGKITELDLSNNRITDVGAEHLVRLVKGRYEILDIKVNGNLISKQLKDSIAYYTEYNRQPKNLKQILINTERNTEGFDAIDVSELVRNHVTDVSARYLADCLNKNHTVETVNLSNNHIGLQGTQALMQMLKKNTTITSFSLNNNIFDTVAHAEAVADMLKHNKTLRSLRLRANDATDEGCILLREALTVNDSLVELDLRDNQVSKEEMGYLRDAINLNSQSILKGMLPQIRANALDTVDAESRNYDDRCVNAMAMELEKNTSVTSINLSRNHITDQGLSLLIRASVRHPALKFLDLSHNGISDVGCELLADMLNTNQCLAYLDLRFNKIDKPGMLAFKKVLESNTSLLELKLDGNQDLEPYREEIECMNLNTQPIVKETLPLLAKDDPSITTMNLSRGQFPDSLEGLEKCDEASLKTRCTHNDVTCKLLAPTLEHNTTLTTLNLSNGAITDRGIVFLCKALMINRSITTLHLANCELTGKSGHEMSYLLVVNGILTHINLRSNKIDEEGATQLLKALTSNNCCKVLNLDHNPISDDLQQKLAAAVTLNNEPGALKKYIMDISDGEFVDTISCNGSNLSKPYDDISAEILARTLANNTSVTSLDLSNNNITDSGGVAFTKMLHTNTKLRSLNLAHNKLIGCGVPFIDMSYLNTTLKNLVLDHNQVVPWEVDKAQTLIKLNNHPPKLKKTIMSLMKQDSNQSDVKINCLEPDELGHMLQTISGHDGLLTEEDIINPKPGAQRFFVDDEGVGVLTEYLKTDIYARTLDLAHNRITDVGARHIADMLKINKQTLTAIDLSNNILTDDGATALCRQIAGSTTLTSLSLSNNAINDKGANEYLKLLNDNTTIKALDMSKNNLSAQVFSKVILTTALNHQHAQLRGLLRRTMDNDPDLIFLDLAGFASRGWWAKNSLELVGKAMASNTHISRISLKYCDLSDAHIKEIMSLVKYHPQLTFLDLSHNSISQTEIIQQSLAANQTLKYLNLGYNLMSNFELLNIFKMLDTNKTITEVDLSGVEVGDVAIAEMFRCLRYNRTLKQIRITGVPLDIQDEIEQALKPENKRPESAPAPPKSPTAMSDEALDEVLDEVLKE